MKFRTRTRRFAPLYVAIAGITVACGGLASGPTRSASDGGPSASGSSGGIPGGSSGSAAPGASSSGVMRGCIIDPGTAADDCGANNPLSDPTKQANGLLCAPLGSARTCCEVGATVGAQTCNDGGEFNSWGPCVDSSGSTLACASVAGCSPGGIDSTCGGGSSSGSTPPPPPSVCTDPAVNTNPGILVAYSPTQGTSVSTNGVIKVWVNDKEAPFVAPGEQIDPTSGLVTAPGNRSATAADGLLYEPVLYFAPQTPLNGGMPYFPSWIKGQYNNQPPAVGPYQTSCCMDPLPFAARDQYSVEYVWDVSKMDLGPGAYTVLFVIHDGDRNRGIGCVTVQVH